MRILKDILGRFFIDDAPMRLEGEEARRFLADMERPVTPERRAFLDECEAQYRKAQSCRDGGASSERG